MGTTSSWVHENSDDIRTDESYCEKLTKLTYPPQRSQKTTSSNGLRPFGFGG